MSGKGNLLSRCFKRSIGTFTTAIAAGAADVECTLFNILATWGRETKQEGSSAYVLKCAGYLLYPTYAANAGALDGTMPGRRFHELLRVRIQPNGWPVDAAINCKGADLRWLNILQGGINAGVDPADLAAAAGAVTREGCVFVPFARMNAERPEDTAIDCLALGRGSHRFGCSAIQADNLTAQAVNQVRIVALLFWGHPGHPIATRFETKDVTSILPDGRIPTQGRRTRTAYLRVDGAQSNAAATHLPGSFLETVQANLWRNGKLEIDQVQIGDLADMTNFQLGDSVNVTGAVGVSILDRADPELVVLQGSGKPEMHSMMPLGDDNLRVRFSADPRDADSTGQNVIAAIDETFPFDMGTPEFEAFAAAAGYPQGAEYHKVPAEKNGNVDPAKQDALPWRMRPRRAA